VELRKGVLAILLELTPCSPSLGVPEVSHDAVSDESKELVLLLFIDRRGDIVLDRIVHGVPTVWVICWDGIKTGEVRTSRFTGDHGASLLDGESVNSVDRSW
jgi:hypothetical protein